MSKRVYIPYSTQTVSGEDITYVSAALQSGWLTGGKAVRDFEAAMASYCGCAYAAAVSSGTAALHACIRAINIRPTDEIIVPAISFAATANAVVYEGGIPIFCDVVEDTLLIDCNLIEKLITPKTRAVIAVDYAGQLCDYADLKRICNDYNLTLIADSCHSLGAEQNGKKTGNLADLTAFSFHPVKQITTGEGGMVMTNNQEFYSTIQKFRNHGINLSSAERETDVTFEYDIENIGYNYRLTDIQASLGLSQLKRLDAWIAKRRKIALRYDQTFSANSSIKPLSRGNISEHAYHLYVIKLEDRNRIFSAMRNIAIGVNVHYKPIYLHSFYQKNLGTRTGLCPVAEKAYQFILSLPIYPSLTLDDHHYVIEKIIEHAQES